MVSKTTYRYDEDKNAVMMAQEEFEIQIDAMNTPSEHEDAGDRV